MIRKVDSSQLWTGSISPSARNKKATLRAATNNKTTQALARMLIANRRKEDLMQTKTDLSCAYYNMQYESIYTP